MRKAIIVFGSTMGTTRSMADIVESEMKASGVFDVETKDASETDPEVLLENDVIVFGCSTWGDGVLQDDFDAFSEKLKTLDLSGKRAAVFGPGESSYPQFCKAVDLLEGILAERGAEIAHKGLKADVLKGDHDVKTLTWAKEFIVKIS